MPPMEGFQVTYQANLQVVIPATALHQTVLGKTTKSSVSFYLVHTTLPNLVVFIHTTLYKKKPRDVAKLCARKCRPCCAKPLHEHPWSYTVPCEWCSKQGS